MESRDLDYDDIMALYELYSKQRSFLRNHPFLVRIINLNYPTVQSRIGDTGTEKLETTATPNADGTAITTAKVAVSHSDTITEATTEATTQTSKRLEPTFASIETTSENNCGTNIVKVVFDFMLVLTKPQ